MIFDNSLHQLLWSPVVDSLYIPSVGRRRSWIIPIQLLIGVFLLWLGSEIDVMLEKVEPLVSTANELTSSPPWIGRVGRQYAHVCLYFSGFSLGDAGYCRGR